GSSSIKFALYRIEDGEHLLVVGGVERIGEDGGRFYARDEHGQALVAQPVDAADHAAALGQTLGWLGGPGLGQGIEAVGHRVVHGGARFEEPARVTAKMVAALRALVPLAPEHLPHEIAAMEAVERTYPHLAQVACFDTAFHRGMPPEARVYA